MKGYSRHNSSLIGRKNLAKFENDRISRNGHRIKTTQPNLMILVSFSSAEDVSSNDVNRYNTFSSQGTENPPFRFKAGHPYRPTFHEHVHFYYTATIQRVHISHTCTCKLANYVHIM